MAVDVTSVKNEFITQYNKYITRDGAKEFLSYLESTDFFTAPASSRYHGSYEGGLCVHSMNVFIELIRLMKAYPEIKMTAETAAIISLLHDVCKIGCYKTSTRNVKDSNNKWIQVPYYEFKEDFCFGGHGSKSVYLIQKYMKLTDEEAVAINSHMGAYTKPTGDTSVSNAYRQFPIAWLLHAADESASYIREKE